MKSIIFTLSFIFLGFASGAQVVYKHDAKTVPVEKVPIFFALPEVVLKVSVTQTRTKVVPGRFYNSGCLKALMDSCELFIDADIKKKVDSLLAGGGKSLISYSLEDISITPFSVADNSKVYYLGAKNNLINEKIINLAFGEGGVIKTGSFENNNELVATVVALINNGLAALNGKGFPDPDAVVKRVEPVVPACGNRQFNLVVNKISDIQKKMNDLLKQVAYGDGDAIKFQLNILENQKRNLIEEITFKITEKTTSVCFDVKPDNNLKTTPLAIFGFSDTAGIKLLESVINQSYNSYSTEGFKIVKTVTAAEAVTLKAKPHSTITSSVGDLYVEGKTGYPYNNPESTSFSLLYDDEVIGSVNTSIPQYGSVLYLPSNLKAVSVEYNGLTGRIEKVTTKTKTIITSKDAESISGSLNKLLESSKPKSELDRLKEEREMLEEKEKIKKLKEGNPET